LGPQRAWKDGKLKNFSHERTKLLFKDLDFLFLAFLHVHAIIPQNINVLGTFQDEAFFKRIAKRSREKKGKKFHRKGNTPSKESLIRAQGRISSPEEIAVH